MGHGSGYGSVLVNGDEENDSPVEKVSPVKPKKPSRRATRGKKDEPKEPPKDWTMAEEIALCQACQKLRGKIEEIMEEDLGQFSE
nr:hypothetical protein [Tanacetum cinerariifolium]